MIYINNTSKRILFEYLLKEQTNSSDTKVLPSANNVSGSTMPAAPQGSNNQNTGIGHIPATDTFELSLRKRAEESRKKAEASLPPSMRQNTPASEPAPAPAPVGVDPANAPNPTQGGTVMPVTPVETPPIDRTKFEFTPGAQPVEPKQSNTTGFTHTQVLANATDPNFTWEPTGSTGSTSSTNGSSWWNPFTWNWRGFFEEYDNKTEKKYMIDNYKSKLLEKYQILKEQQYIYVTDNDFQKKILRENESDSERSARAREELVIASRRAEELRARKIGTTTMGELADKRLEAANAAAREVNTINPLPSQGVTPEKRREHIDELRYRESLKREARRKANQEFDDANPDYARQVKDDETARRKNEREAWENRMLGTTPTPAPQGSNNQIPVTDTFELSPIKKAEEYAAALQSGNPEEIRIKHEASLPPSMRQNTPASKPAQAPSAAPAPARARPAKSEFDAAWEEARKDLDPDLLRAAEFGDRHYRTAPRPTRAAPEPTADSSAPGFGGGGFGGGYRQSQGGDQVGGGELGGYRQSPGGLQVDGGGFDRGPFGDSRRSSFGGGTSSRPVPVSRNRQSNPNNTPYSPRRETIMASMDYFSQKLKNKYNLIREEIVNPKNAGTMSKKEIASRDQLATKVKAKPIKGKDTEKNAKYRLATFITLRNRKGN